MKIKQVFGQPFNWNVIAIHSRVPDGKVLSLKLLKDIWEEGNTKENKLITLTDGNKLYRDDGVTNGNITMFKLELTWIFGIQIWVLVKIAIRYLITS